MPSKATAFATSEASAPSAMKNDVKKRGQNISAMAKINMMAAAAPMPVNPARRAASAPPSLLAACATRMVVAAAKPSGTMNKAVMI